MKTNSYQGFELYGKFKPGKDTHIVAQFYPKRNIQDIYKKTLMVVQGALPQVPVSLKQMMAGAIITTGGLEGLVIISHKDEVCVSEATIRANVEKLTSKPVNMRARDTIKLLRNIGDILTYIPERVPVSDEEIV